MVGVFAAERITTILNSEKPMTMTVKHKRTVFANTFCCFIVRKSPQKHAPRRATMKKTAPLLNGRPRVFTKKRSKYAANFGRYGIIPKRITARITTETANIFTYSHIV